MLLDWYSCGTDCMTARAGQYMAHIKNTGNSWFWSWGDKKGLSPTLEEARIELNKVIQPPP